MGHRVLRGLSDPSDERSHTGARGYGEERWGGGGEGETGGGEKLVGGLYEGELVEGRGVLVGRDGGALDAVSMILV